MDTGEEIYNLIVNEPGIHFRGIMDRMQKQIGVISYHINKMELEDKIISIRHRKLKLFFSKSWEENVNEIKSVITNLRKKIPRLIIMSLAQYPNTQSLSLKDLSALLQMPTSSFHWYIKRLIEDGILKPIRKGRTVLLTFKVDPLLIKNLGKKIYPTKWDKFLDEVDSIFHLSAL